MPNKLDAVLAGVKWVQNNIDLERWNPRHYPRKYGHRSAEQIIRSGKTNYMNPCLDLTLVLVSRLKEKGFNPALVLQELVNRHTGRAGLHFAVEVPAGKTIYSVDFKHFHEAVCYKGRFSPVKSLSGVKNIALKRYSTKNLGAGVSFLQFVGTGNWKQIGKTLKHFRYGDALAGVRAMKKSDSPELFKEAKAKKPRIRRL